MNIDAHKTTLAARREALIVECARQRTEVAHEIGNLSAPSILSGGSIGRYLSAGNLKLPLTIAGVVLGMVVAKPSRAMPLLATGMSLFKLVTSVLSVLRKPAA